MPVSAQIPYSALLYSGSTVTATATSDFDMPNDIIGGEFIVDQGTGTGTSPTLDVSIQTSPDNGTTYYVAARFAQLTTTAAKMKLTVSSRPTNVAGVAATITAATGGALSGNFVFTRKMRVVATIGGTNPSYATIKVWFNGWRSIGGAEN